MPVSKSDIISQLKHELRDIQHIRSAGNNDKLDASLGPIRFAFPGNTFPVGATHEFLCDTKEMLAPTSGFVLGLMSHLMGETGVSIWISANRTIFPPGLLQFSLPSDKLIFIDAKNEKQVTWMLEEALKCNSISTVIGELKELDFTMSRRLQLAVEKNNVTGFLLRTPSGKTSTTASFCRWRISSLPAIIRDGLPGVGYPRWQVELLKVRNGQPGKWEVEFHADGFFHAYKFVQLARREQRKTG